MRFAYAFAALAVVASQSAVAAVPTKITYQGRLTNGGVPVNATVSMTVKLYDHPTAGNLIWLETQSVAVANGLYNVILGNTQPLDENMLAAQLYLTVAVEFDPDMMPRVPLTSAPYAIRAKALDGTLGVAGGGTGATTFGEGRLLYGQGTGAIGALANAPGGRILVSGFLPTDPPTWSGVTADFNGLILAANQGILIGIEQVVGARQPAVADAVNATGVDVADPGPTQVVTVAEYNALVARFNELLDRLRNHGLIAP